MAATSKGLAPNERDTLFKTLQGLIQNGDVPLDDLNSLVAELNHQTTTTKAGQLEALAAFHDSHLSDIFAADEFGDFAAAATEGSSEDLLFEGEEATEWPDESENPFPDDFIAADAAALGFLVSSVDEKSSSKSRGRNSSDHGSNVRGRSRNTRSKPKAEDVSAWEPFDVPDSSFPAPMTPTIRRKSKVEGSTTAPKPSKKRETTAEERVRDATRTNNTPATAENLRRRTSSSHRTSRESDMDPTTKTPTKTREKTRSLSRKKKGDGASHRGGDDTKKLDAVLSHMMLLSEDNLTTSGDTATTSSETRAPEEAHKKSSPRRKVVTKVAAGIRADDVSTFLKAIESGMIETNAAGKIVVRMGKKKSGEGCTSLSRVLDAQKMANGSAENRSIRSAPVQTTERLPGSPAAVAAQRRRSRSRKSRLEGTEEESLRERSKSQGRQHDPVEYVVR